MLDGLANSFATIRQCDTQDRQINRSALSWRQEVGRSSGIDVDLAATCLNDECEWLAHFPIGWFSRGSRRGDRSSKRHRTEQEIMLSGDDVNSPRPDPPYLAGLDLL